MDKSGFVSAHKSPSALFAAPKKDLALLLEAGFVYRYAGRTREARETFLGVRALTPDQEAGYLALAGLCFDEGNFTEGEACCLRALELNPSSAEAYAQLAEIQLYRGDKAHALATLKKVLEIRPRGPVADLAHALLKVAHEFSFAARTAQKRPAKQEKEPVSAAVASPAL